MKKLSSVIGWVSVTLVVTLPFSLPLLAKNCAKLHNQGNGYIHSGEYDKAIELLKQAVKCGSLYSFDALGVAYFGKGDYDEAIRTFTAAWDMPPYTADKRDEAWTLAYRGRTYFFQGRWEEAAKDYTAAVETGYVYWQRRSPTWMQQGGSSWWQRVFHWRAEVYLVKGLYQEAMKDLEKTLGLKLSEDYRPFRVSCGSSSRRCLTERNWQGATLRLMAFAKLGLGEGEMAVALIEDAKRADPDYDPSYDLFRIYSVLGDEEAASRYQSGASKSESQIESDPMFAPLLARRKARASAIGTVATLEERGELRTALQQYIEISKSMGLDSDLRRRIIKLVHRLDPPPDIPEEARRHFVIAFGAMKDAAQDPSRYDLALDEYSRAVQLAPWWAEAYWNMAAVQEHLGKYAEAAKTLELYLLVAREESEARQVRDKIYELEYKAKAGPPKPN